MKTRILKVNKFLLEKYPNIWNTKIIWTIAISLIVHLLFFLFGLISLNNVELLHKRDAISNFFDNGSIFFSVIITTLILVIWIVHLFKNNSFKSFYPTTRSNLFGQFLSYFIIIFFASTFYYSYIFGVKTYINFTHKTETVINDIKTVNDGALFFSKDFGNYTLNNLRYPNLFSETYCETKESLIDFNKPYLELFHFNYQFYTLKTLEKKHSELYIDSIYGGSVFSKSLNSHKIYYYKDSVIDVSDKIRTVKPSYFNFTKTFYDLNRWNNSLKMNSDELFYHIDIEVPYQNNKHYTEKLRLRNKRNYELLTRNDPREINQLLSNVLEISSKYKIRHNLTSDKWFKLIYHPENFELKAFLRNEPKGEDSEIELINSDYIIDDITVAAEKNLSEQQKFIKERMTDYYIDTYSLQNVFENIEEIKNEDVVSESIHFFLWVSFFIASLIFIFRITGLKESIFTVISVGLLILLISLLAILFSYATNSFGIELSNLMLYLTFFIATIILFIPLFFSKKIKKLVVAICINISITGFPLYILLILGIISLHQTNYCIEKFGVNYHDNDCFILLNEIGFSASFMLLILGFIFIFFFSDIIRKWRALPEH